MFLFVVVFGGNQHEGLTMTFDIEKSTRRITRQIGIARRSFRRIERAPMDAIERDECHAGLDALLAVDEELNRLEDALA